MKRITNTSAALVLVTSIAFVSCKKDEIQPAKSHLIDSQISLSPDDKTIAFAYVINNVQAIYTVDTSGNNIKKLTNPSNEVHSNVTYSPDGKKILFLSHPLEPIKKRRKEIPNIQYLYIMNADGSGLQQLTFENVTISNPSFSQEGSKIYFIRSEFGGNASPMTGTPNDNYDIYSINIDGSNYYNVTNKHGDTPSVITSSDYSKYLSSPGLSKDGAYYAAQRGGPKPGGGYIYELYLVDMNTKGEKQITHLEKSVNSPCFFSNNNRIVFLEQVNWPTDYDTPADHKLRIIDTDGSNLKQIDIKI